MGCGRRYGFVPRERKSLWYSAHDCSMRNRVLTISRPRAPIFSEVRAFGHFDHCLRQALDVRGLRKKCILPFHSYFVNTAGSRGNNWKAGCDGLKQGDGETLAQGTEHEDVEFAEKLWGIGQGTGEGDTVSKIQLFCECFEFLAKWSVPGRWPTRHGELPERRQRTRAARCSGPLRGPAAPRCRI